MRRRQAPGRVAAALVTGAALAASTGCAGYVQRLDDADRARGVAVTAALEPALPDGVTVSVVVGSYTGGFHLDSTDVVFGLPDGTDPLTITPALEATLVDLGEQAVWYHGGQPTMGDVTYGFTSSDGALSQLVVTHTAEDVAALQRNLGPRSAPRPLVRHGEAPRRPAPSTVHGPLPDPTATPGSGTASPSATGVEI